MWKSLGIKRTIVLQGDGAGLLQTIMDGCQQAYCLPSPIHGLSHGLKIARQLSIFAQPLAGPPFRAQFFRRTKKEERHLPLLFFGTPEGTRTPDLLVRSQSLYPTELPAHKHSKVLRYNNTCNLKKQAFF